MIDSDSKDSKLMPCPDCDNQISRRAHSCPHCGCPAFAINEQREKLQQTFDLSPPVFPKDLSVGRKIDSFTAILEEGESSIGSLLPGTILIMFHEKGLRLGGLSLPSQGKDPFYEIHYSQIIDAKYIDRTSLVEFVEKDKSVIGRAVVGAIICGPIGAIVGGISGIGKKKIGPPPHCLILNFWAICSIKGPTPSTIILSGKGFAKKTKFEETAHKISINKANWLRESNIEDGLDNTWYAKIKNDVLGPFTHQEVISLFNDGVITDKTLMRKTGEDYVLKLKRVKNFKDYLH